MTEHLQSPDPGLPPPPRMTSQVEKSIMIAPGEVPEVQRFLEQMRAQKAMEAGGGNQDIAGIVNEFMKRQLSLIRGRIAGLSTHSDSTTSLVLQILAIIDEHIQALE